MTRFLCALALVTMVAAPTSDPVAAADRPNILFIMTDDHAAHAISAYGSHTGHRDRPGYTPFVR